MRAPYIALHISPQIVLFPSSQTKDIDSMNRHMDTPTDAVEMPNPFRQVREHLNLTEKELAELLGASFYAVVRWERGDSTPPEDIINALDSLIAAKGKAKASRGAPRSSQAIFASTGARKKAAPLPLLD